jgi:hypothetical protein
MGVDRHCEMSMSLNNGHCALTMSGRIPENCWLVDIAYITPGHDPLTKHGMIG